MDELRKALVDIGSIRRQIAHATEFRGYGPATLAGTAAFAIVAALFQERFMPDPTNHLALYLAIWVWTAAASAALIGAQMRARSRRIHSGLADEMIRMAVEQFLPSAVVGALVTVVLVRYVPQGTWMIPGLWQITSGLGVFSSSRFLPRQIVAAGAWYVLAGLFCIALGNARALSPWAMGIPYSVGQSLVAGILLFCSERDGSET